MNDLEELPITEYYLVCLDCDDTIIDFWKYDSMRDTDHYKHNVRPMKDSNELRGILDNCKKEGCLDQEYCGIQSTRLENLLRFMKL